MVLCFVQILTDEDENGIYLNFAVLILGLYSPQPQIMK